MRDSESSGTNARRVSQMSPKRNLRGTWSLVPQSEWGGLVLLSTLMSGTTGAFPQEVLFDHVGDGWREDNPNEVHVIGDVNQDDVDDFVLGFPVKALVSVRSGRDGELLAQHFLPSTAGNFTWYGRSVAGLGDFDGDGVPDYAIGIPDYSLQGSYTGAAEVRSGATHHVIAHISEGNPGETQGHQVVRMGDVNGDGFMDVGVLGRLIPSDAPLRIYLGPDATPYRVQFRVVNGLQNVREYGDWDGDGCSDYLAQVLDLDAPPDNRGKVRLFSGKTGQSLLELVGQGALHENFGNSMCVVGDWDGDGVDDIAVCAPGGTQLNAAGGLAVVYVFSGANAALIHVFHGSDYCEPDSLFGLSVDAGKDLNGDGWNDLLIGAPLEVKNHPEPFERQEGSAFVFSGATKSLLYEYRGGYLNDFTGYRMRLLDDRNSDGLAEWAVLSRGYDIPDGGLIGRDVGRLQVFAGAPGDAVPRCQPSANSVGDGGRLWNSGPISVEQNRMELVASGLPDSTLVLFLAGDPSAPVPFGAGELCLAQPLAWLGIEQSGSESGSPNQASLDLDLSSSPLSSTESPLTPGDVWSFQAVYRDEGRRHGTNALEVTFVP